MKIYWSSRLSVERVWSDLLDQKNKKNDMSMFGCPAIRGALKNVFMAVMPETLVFNVGENDQIDSVYKSQKSRPESLVGGNTFQTQNFPIYFWSEEPVMMRATAPWFHKTSYQSKGTVYPGEFNVGKWFRPLQLELHTWQKNDVVEIKENEPLYYIEFFTDKHIELQRFHLSPELLIMSDILVNSPWQQQDSNTGTFNQRYEAYEKSDFAIRIKEEIQANLM